MSADYDGCGYDRSFDARCEDEQRRMDEEDWNAHHRLERLWHAVKWHLFWNPYGKLRGWW